MKPKRMIPLICAAYLFFSVIGLQAQSLTEILNDATSTLARKDYAGAVRLYEAALQKDNHEKNLSKSDREWAETLKNIAEKRSQPGSGTPRYKQKILGIHVSRFKGSFTDLKHKVHHIDNSMDEKHKSAAIAEQKIAQIIVEAYSNGNYTYEFDNIDLDAALTELSVSEWEGRKVELRSPVLETITPFEPFANILKKNLNQYDTFIIYWPAENAGTTAGGGVGSLPLIPYQLNSPHRGVATMPSSNRPASDNWRTGGVVFHELFHALQGMSCHIPAPGSCIGQIHEWLEPYRRGLPAEAGRTEHEYYRWRFDKTLAKAGWENLNFRIKYLYDVSEESFSRIQKAADAISMEKRKKALKLYQEGAAAASGGNPVKAAGLYREALKLNPDHPGTLLALARYHKKQPDQSLQYYNRLIEIIPDNDVYLYERGGIYNGKKDQTHAIEDFSKAIAINPDNDQAHYLRAINLAALRKHKEAEEDYAFFMERNPRFEWGWYNRGNNRMQLKDYENAEKDFTTAIEIKPDFDWAFYIRGLVRYYHLNKKQEGASDLKEAARLGNEQAKSTIQREKL